ncbi:urease accessory protein UreD [Pseudonocardia abyssalis]|uniref:Urease accessory protein UreD n=1 Tax=Pseudonocardia abyssalis TaxID=2792008 RepID=A0ABS6UYX5_9PSEU|nr:urease accessory protein UreD [Pseudonocardia abyssalis]MBW0116017.1 urease accessory protein UreD [Pseudonocardia abyssalis]MBW0137465.1 urease accessory protein UreD [Pseudonocardia abyssalis]
MRSRARLVVAAGGAVRELRSQAPLTLLPRRGTAAGRDPALTVHLVGSAATPLGGDDVELDVVVEPGAHLVLTGVAAAVALAAPGGSRFAVRLEIGGGASVRYLPEPTVVTRRADHLTVLDAVLGDGARLRCRDVLVAGRHGEAPGRYRGSTRVTGPGGPLLVQTQDLDPSPAHLAGRRVLATEVLVWGEDPAEASTGEWWSLTPLARGGTLATAVGPDAVTTQRDLATAVAAHPGWSSTVLAAVPSLQ